MRLTLQVAVGAGTQVMSRFNEFCIGVGWGGVEVGGGVGLGESRTGGHVHSRSSFHQEFVRIPTTLPFTR